MTRYGYVDLTNGRPRPGRPLLPSPVQPQQPGHRGG